MLTRRSDGTRVVIRRIRPTDKRMLAKGLELLPEDTRRKRFLSAKPRFSAAELRYLTEIDGEAHFAFVAVLADRLDNVVAVGRFVRLPGDRATSDVSIVVVDPLQRLGLCRRPASSFA